MLDGRLFDPNGPWREDLHFGRWLALIPVGMATSYAVSSMCVAALGIFIDAVGRLDAMVGLLAILLGLLSSSLSIVFGLVATFSAPSRPYLWAAAECVFLVALPVWGGCVNYTLDPCTRPCNDTYAALSPTGTLFVFTAYGAGLIAYLVFRRRAGLLPLSWEAALLGLLFQAALTCGVLTVHFGARIPMGLVFAPVGLPLVAPVVGGAVFAGMGLWRVWRLGGGTSGIVGVTTSIALGLWTMMSFLLSGILSPFGGAFGQTCGWTLSQMQPPPGECHYLCTVAAQGHPWLVRPLRLGRRRGSVIIVNRQLAVANAFEDLLHERWPRFGAWARRQYDRFGYPISRHLLHPITADILFLCMLPIQWGFYAFLLLFDPSDPEERVDRMYR